MFRPAWASLGFP